jgi:hypothetical protein
MSEGPDDKSRRRIHTARHPQRDIDIYILCPGGGVPRSNVSISIYIYMVRTPPHQTSSSSVDSKKRIGAKAMTNETLIAVNKQTICFFRIQDGHRAHVTSKHALFGKRGLYQPFLCVVFVHQGQNLDHAEDYHDDTR